MPHVTIVTIVTILSWLTVDLKELKECASYCLNWELNEMEIGCNCENTLIGCNEKSQFWSNLTLSLDGLG